MDQSWTHERAKVASLSNRRPADDPELVTARQNLKTLRLEEHIHTFVDAWPPPRPEQLTRLAALLVPVVDR